MPILFTLGPDVDDDYVEKVAADVREVVADQRQRPS